MLGSFGRSGPRPQFTERENRDNGTRVMPRLTHCRFPMDEERDPATCHKAGGSYVLGIRVAGTCTHGTRHEGFRCE